MVVRVVHHPGRQVAAGVQPGAGLHQTGLAGRHHLDNDNDNDNDDDNGDNDYNDDVYSCNSVNFKLGSSDFACKKI